MAHLRMHDVTKQFGQSSILRGIDLDVASGELLILVGPSGCGKSTLMNIIAGLERPTGGRVLIAGRDVTGVAPKDRDIAMVFQSYALYPTMTVRQNIAFGLQTRGVPRAEQQAAVARVSKMLQLDALLERRPSQLSGGQRQRVAMGRALARNPKLFLFDEPLSNLDAKLRVEMRTEIKLLHQRLRTTTVYVTHDQIEAMTLGDRIAVMKDGLIQQLGTPREIYDRPSNVFVAGFIGSPAMNLLRCTLEESAARVGITLRGAGESRFFALPEPVGRVGQAVIVGVRPEQISAAGDGLSCHVDVVEPTGPDTNIYFQLNGQECVARLHPRDAPAAGSGMRVRVDLSRAVLFDAASEQRLAA